MPELRTTRRERTAGAARRAGLRALVGVILLATSPSFAAPPPEGAPDAAALESMRLMRKTLKRLEAELVLEPARKELADQEELREKIREAKKARRRRPGARSTVLREPLGPPMPPELAPRASTHPSLAANQLLPPQNIFTQSEVSVAAHGRFVVAAWNDGARLDPPGPMSFATSSDGGVTWRAGGGPPTTDTLFTWEADPVVAVNPKTGAFYLAGLGVAQYPPRNALMVVRGAFADTGFAWGQPRFVRAARDTLPDKPWMAVDTLTGCLYLTYTSFFRLPNRARFADQIEIVRSVDDGVTWSPPAILTTPPELGLVQGSRVAVGPDGEVHVVWGFVDTTEASGGRDFIRTRTSRDGVRFEEPVSAVGYFPNFGSGPPGYNRLYGISFPSLAVDRSDGPYRGRVYVSWHEPLNYFDDRVGYGAVLNERNAVDTAPQPFAIGDVIRGSRTAEEAADVYRFAGHGGQTVVLYTDSLAAGLDIALFVTCRDGTRLALSDPPRFGRASLAVVTLPVTDEYLLRVELVSNTSGGYRVSTGLADRRDERGRDSRDVFVAWSDDGRSWSQGVRVGDAAPRFDEWLPEPAVAPDGRVFLGWYDWRDSPSPACGALSNVYLAQSLDGGMSWRTLGPVTSQSSEWTRPFTNLVPNQGDYLGLMADDASLVVAWADTRNGNVDAFFARLALDTIGIAPPKPGVTIASVRPNPTPGEVIVECAIAPDRPAVLEVWDVAGRRVAEQAVTPDPDGRVTVRLTPERPLPIGVYVVRIRQGTDAAGARVAVIR